MNSQEYKDYIQTPNRYTASQLITKICTENKNEISELENYVQYIGLRPRVEKQGSHGLFSQEDEPINIYDSNDNYIELIENMKLYLTKEDITIILLHLIDDLKFDDIALKLNQKVKTIKTKYYRALKKYQKMKGVK